MVLRKYYYLDESFINDAYSSIFGYDHEEREITSITEKQGNANASFDKGVKVGVGGSKNSADTVKINASKTPSAKLQEILDYLKDENGEEIPYYDQLNDDTFTGLNRDDLIEGVFSLSLTKLETYAQIANTANLLSDVFSIESLSDEKTAEIVSTINKLADAERSKGIACILRFVNDKNKYPCYCRLDQSFLRVNQALLQTEVTIIGKISRIIPKGQVVNLTDITELTKIKIPNANTRQGKQQRVQQIKSGQNPASMKILQDEIKGPAIEIVPIAIYK